MVPDFGISGNVSPNERSIFIDEGGDEARPLMCGLVIDAEMEEAAVDLLVNMRSTLEPIIPGLRDLPEYHANRLGRHLSKRERVGLVRKGGMPLLDYQRAFIFQHVLSGICEMPGNP
jgi:hypothetical protein